MKVKTHVKAGQGSIGGGPLLHIPIGILIALGFLELSHRSGTAFEQVFGRGNKKNLKQEMDNETTDLAVEQLIYNRLEELR